MKRLTILFVLVFSALLVVEAKESKKPNIILVMADDQGWGQTSYYNHPILKTPNLDKMAENGIRLKNFINGISPSKKVLKVMIIQTDRRNQTAIEYFGKHFHNINLSLNSGKTGQNIKQH